MTETVTIKSTEKLRELAQTTIQIQDACNMLAVANHLQNVIKYFRDGKADGQPYSGSDFSQQNPVTISVINKIEHLAGMDQGKPMAFIRCMELAEGHDVEWDVDFLN